MRKGIWIIALLLIGILSYAQSNATDAGDVAKSITKSLAGKAADALAYVAGGTFWAMVVIGALYGYANYAASSTLLGGFFATAVLNWIKEHIKAIMIALAIPFIIAFIVGSVVTGIATAYAKYGYKPPDAGEIIIKMFLKSISFNIFE